MSNRNDLGKPVLMCLGDRCTVDLKHYDIASDTLDGIASHHNRSIRVTVVGGSGYTAGRPHHDLPMTEWITGCRPWEQRMEGGRKYMKVYLPIDASEEQYAELVAWVGSQEHGQPSDQRDVTMGDGGEKPNVGGGRVDDTPTAEIPDATEYHPADVDQSGDISKKEAREWNAEHPDEPVKRG